jgi:hypothetical protein
MGQDEGQGYRGLERLEPAGDTLVITTTYEPIRLRVDAAVLRALGYAPHTRDQLRINLIAANIYGCAAVLDASLAELLAIGRITVAGRPGEETYFLARNVET